MNTYYGEDSFPFEALGMGIRDFLKPEEGLMNLILPILCDINSFFYQYTDILPIYLKHAVMDIYGDINPKVFDIKNDVYRNLIHRLIEVKVPFYTFISYTKLYDAERNNQKEFENLLDNFTHNNVKNELEKISKKKLNK